MSEIDSAVRHQRLLLPEHGMPAGQLQQMIGNMDPDIVLSFSFEASDIMVFSTIGVIINRQERTVTGPLNRTVEPSFTEFELIDYLASRPDKLVTREELYSHVWGNDTDPNTNLVRVHFWNVKDKLFKKADVPKSVFRTIHSAGYLLRTNLAEESQSRFRSGRVPQMIG
jgi:DNA-binding response OmpR family regulator